jgi:hypothetical protein
MAVTRSAMRPGGEDGGLRRIDDRVEGVDAMHPGLLIANHPLDVGPQLASLAGSPRPRGGLRSPKPQRVGAV